MAAIVREARMLARARLPILLTGPTGTGKTRMARAIHDASGRRGEFEIVDCAGAEGALLRADLFGAVRGAYTGCDRDRRGAFARADRGTLFLDEVGELAAGDQARLLKALEEQEFRPVGGEGVVRVDVRVVAATLRGAGELRGDLAQRLGTELRMPALADRPDDVEVIARAALGDAISAEAVGWLEWQAWPGNVRELLRVLEVAALRAGGGRVEVRHLEGAGAEELGAALGRAESRVEEELRRLIDAALAASDGSEREAARRLGWARSTFRDRRRKLAPGQPNDEGRTSGVDVAAGTSGKIRR